MKQDLLYVWLMLVFGFANGACTDCREGNGEGGDAPWLSVPEVTVQNLDLKNVILPEQTVRLRANILQAGKADIQWFVDDAKVSTDTIYAFSSAVEGTFRVKATVFNSLGESTDSIKIRVVDGFGMADITNWTGEGENQAVLAIQWVSEKVEDLLHPNDEDVFFRAWGYKWNSADERTGYDMIEAIARKDPRLFVLVVEEENQGIVVKGFGYDGNGDGRLEIKSADADAQNGILLTEADFIDGICQLQDKKANIDGFAVLSEEDYWIGGWKEAYTSYWLASGDAVLDPDEYEYSNFHARNRTLENKSWDAWTLSPINSAESNMLPKPVLLKPAPGN